MKSIKRFSWIPFYEEMATKLLSFKEKRQKLVDMVYATGFANYIEGVDSEKVNDIDPFTVFGLFNRGLKNENRIKLAKYFKDKLGIKAKVPCDFDGIPVLNNQKATFFYREEIATAVQPLWNLFDAAISKDVEVFKRSFNIVRKQRGIKWNITMGLFWIRPNEYIALDSINRAYLELLGIEVFNEKHLNAENYIGLLSNVRQKLGNNELSESSIPEISYKAWTTNVERHYWLLGYMVGGHDSQLERFFKDGVWEGRFDKTNAASKAQLDLTQDMRDGDVIILKSVSTKGSKHDQPFIRIKGIGVIKGDVKTTDIEGLTSCQCNVEYVPMTEVDFDDNIYGAYQKTVHLAEKSRLSELIAFVDSILNKWKQMEQQTNKYQKYIDLLKANHNIVLTGAPGTGKTYMAQAIAKEMGCEGEEVEFVQFHPSYDYTDFVEGLRPKDIENGQIGFERKNGVFKDFCSTALQIIIDSKKSAAAIGVERSWKETLDTFISDAIEYETEYALIRKDTRFKITDQKRNTITVLNEKNEKTSNITVSTDDILSLLSDNVKLNTVRDIRRYFGRKFQTQPDSYVYAIVNEIRKIKNDVKKVDAQKVAVKPFVFIIDEINRGEASKIFGELFYAIDPDYRSNTKVRVQTQYQNLIPESDVFGRGFFVPENVYIIGTMNDIDRSVESMDFAMRRRFTWIEVTPDDTEGMLDEVLDATLAVEAKTRMRSLNKKISDTEGLGKAYQVGPAYFKKLPNFNDNFNALWKMNIEPLLKEYLRGFRKADDILDDFAKAYNNQTELPVELDDNVVADD